MPSGSRSSPLLPLLLVAVAAGALLSLSLFRNYDTRHDQHPLKADSPTPSTSPVGSLDADEPARPFSPLDPLLPIPLEYASAAKRLGVPAAAQIRWRLARIDPSKLAHGKSPEDLEWGDTVTLNFFDGAAFTCTTGGPQDLGLAKYYFLRDGNKETVGRLDVRRTKDGTLSLRGELRTPAGYFLFHPLYLDNLYLIEEVDPTKLLPELAARAGASCLTQEP